MNRVTPARSPNARTSSLVAPHSRPVAPTVSHKPAASTAAPATESPFKKLNEFASSLDDYSSAGADVYAPAAAPATQDNSKLIAGVVVVVILFLLASRRST